MDIPDFYGTDTITYENEGGTPVEHNFPSEINSQVISEDNEPLNPGVNEVSTRPATTTPTT